MGVGLFSDCVFFLKVNSLPFKEKTNLKTCITSNGGAISFIVNEKCTHAVVVNNAALNSSQQKNIQKHCIPVVMPDFIWRSIQENRLVEVELSGDRELEVNLEEVKDDKKSRFRAKFMKHTKTDIAERDFIDEEIEEQGDENDVSYDAEVAKYSLFQKGEEIAIVELLCLSEQSPFPFKVSTLCGIPGTSQKEYSFNLVDSSEKACNKYEQRMKDLKNKGFTQTDKIRPEAEFLASQALQKVLLGEALNVVQLSPEVGGFVESIWTEAQGHLSSILSCPMENISLNDVSKAEGILQNVRNALNKGEDIKELMQDFYRCLPHRYKQQTNVDKKFLTVKQDLCQLIRDMVNISETNSSGSLPSTVGKYRALKCRVDYVDPNTEEFQRVKQEVLDYNHSNEEFKILRVFRVGRLTEATNFKSDLGNVKPLLHASSPRNIVGILSRGLLLPKMIVDEFGLERTDIGNLGSGIYFSNSVSTSVKYTEVFKSGGARVLLVCDVALGKTKLVGTRDYSITEPPEGFHSIHGVRREIWKNSQFVDDEYVVYDVNQVKMRYVVQFCTSTDTPNLRSGPALTLLEENEQMSCCELVEDDMLEDLPESTNVPKGGLQSKDGQQIPLESIHVKARLKDLAAQVVIFQTYKNNSAFPIEAKYVFPLDSTAAVCGFEAFINGKHIVGEVKEKQQAHQEYRTAISQGHGAYLMDQDASDVFTVSVGNLPAKAIVIIKITYVTELKCSYSTVEFCLPGTVASWQEDKALNENTQDTVTKVGIESDKAAQGNFHLDMSVEMPQKIEDIWCFTHNIKKKKTECKAVVQVEGSSSLTDEGFHIYIRLEDAYIPRMWVETHPDQDSEACMLIFQPKFEDAFKLSSVTIFLDCSNSMESCFHSAQRVALLALNTLYISGINIVTFGSTYKEFYLYPKQTSDLSEMKKFVKMAKPNMGSTELWKPLQSSCLLKPSSGYHKILLISDGHIQNENLVFQILKKNRDIKLFTCGVGAKANKHMLRCLAKTGAGAFEYFADKSKSSWKSQMEKHDTRLKSDVCTAVSIKWRLFDRNPTEPMQAPANIQTLFDEDRLIVYGFVPHCTQATLKAFINDKEFENMVSTTELQKTTGTILHKLTARAFIQDYEDGILHEKEHENEMEKQKMKSFIIKLSKEHSIVTQFTSFVAVEKRSAEESENIEPNILEIISAEDVDILPYMEYTEEEGGIRDSLQESSEEGENFDQNYHYLDMISAEDDGILPDTEEEVTCDCSQSYVPFRAVAKTLRARARPTVISSFDLESTNRLQISSLPVLGFSPNLLGEATFMSTNEPVCHTSGPHAEALKMSLPESPVAYSHFAPPQPYFDGLVDGQSECLDMAVGSLMSQSTSSGPVFGAPSFGAFGGQLTSSSSSLSTERHSFAFSGFKSTEDEPHDYALDEASVPYAPIPPSYFRLGRKMVKATSIPEPIESAQRDTVMAAASDIQLAPLQPCSPLMGAHPPCPPLGRGPPPCPPPSYALSKYPPPPCPPPPCPPRTDVIRHHLSSSFSPCPPLWSGLVCPPPPPPSQLFPTLPFAPPPPPPQLFPTLPLPPPPPPQFLDLAPRRKPRTRRLAGLSWSCFSPLQSQEGYWILTTQLGELLKINVEYFCDHFLAGKGISSLGLRGKDEVLKLIATLLVLQIIHTHHLLSGIKFRTLLKLDQCDSESESYPAIEKAIKWAVKTDRQYSGICIRLGLGKDWDHATRQLLGIEPPSSDLASALCHY